MTVKKHSIDHNGTKVKQFCWLMTWQQTLMLLDKVVSGQNSSSGADLFLAVVHISVETHVMDIHTTKQAVEK